MNASSPAVPSPPIDPPAVDATLRSIVEGTASARGEHFFRTLVQYLAGSLNAKSAFVAEFNPARTAVSTIAVWTDRSLAPNFEFDLAGTPCQHVLSGEIQHFPDDVQKRFPANDHLRELNARSYLAIPLTDDEGRVIGHLAVIDDKPLAADDRHLSIFHIFAARATAELIRRRAEHKLQRSRRREVRLRRQRQRIAAELAYLRNELRSRSEFSEIIGNSDGIWEVLRKIDMVGPVDSTVLILGETGTGKELVARAIHRNSRRHAAPFVRVNCAALPESLLESELFGHERGAFTGADQRRIGRFELADNGTIFLDEIGEMTLAAQSRLLRVLQEREFERLGGSQTIQINTRVLAATHRNLPELVAERRFREDLYYRLNVFPIQIPPLRDRTGDIPAPVEFFADRLAGRLGRQPPLVPADFLEPLQAHHWPGNVRELENIVERAMILASNGVLALPEGLPSGPERPPAPGLRLVSLAEVERAHIQAVLQHTGGVIAGPRGAARILDLNPNTLRSRMDRLGIPPAGPAES